MRNELLLAIFAGLIIGLMIAFGVWRINSSVPKQAESPSLLRDTADGNSTPQDIRADNSGITVTNIEEGAIYTQSLIKISGTLKSQGTVIISGETQDYTIRLFDSNTFEQEITLAKGVNRIIVVGFDQVGQKVNELSYLVVYSPEFDEDL